MKKKGLWGGIIAANSIGIAEIVAISQSFSGFTNMSWKNVATLTVVILVQLVIAIILGKKVDSRSAKRKIISELKTRDFAIEVFDNLAAMATRDNSILTIYLVSINNFEELGRKLPDEEVIRIEGIVEGSISATIRKSDIFVKWDENRYLIIAADRGYKGSTMILRIQSKIDSVMSNEMIKVPLIYGAAAFPVEGTDLEMLADIAYQRLYEERNTAK